MKESESSLPQIDESQPSHSLDNRLIQMRKKALSLTIEVLDESEKMHEAKPEVKESAVALAVSKYLGNSCCMMIEKNRSTTNSRITLRLAFGMLRPLRSSTATPSPMSPASCATMIWK